MTLACAAAVTSGPMSRPQEVPAPVVEVGVGHQHRMVLRAAQGLHALAALGALGIDVFGDGGRADEADGLQ
ncbi:hypothetical protein RLJV_23690 [Pseudomonas aeruginosa]|nr:hypothetical protein RLJV_23690 [Pseudomonas aeruginosa]